MREREAEWALALPNGQYRVRLTFGNTESESLNSIQLEDVTLARMTRLQAGTHAPMLTHSLSQSFG